MSKKGRKKKRRIKYSVVFLFLLVIALIWYLIYHLLNVPISNIFISGNIYLKDQEIIEQANLEDYPSTIKNSSFKIKNKLLKNIYIKNASVYKTFFTTVNIKIVENRPLFYNDNINKTILEDKTETEDNFDVPTLINYVPDTIYDKFIKNMAKINIDILNRMSEIKYDPNDVDDSRFLITMNDGNLVYLTLTKFININDYIEIIKKFDNKKGILYLDDGEYFEIK